MPGMSRSWVAGAALLVACGSEHGDATATVTDSAGVTIVSNSGGGGWPHGRAPRLAEDLSIGTLEGPEEYTFANLAAVAVGAGDTIYALDRGDKRVKVYDPGGRYLRAFGGEGGGPGEFQEPDLLTFVAGQLVIYDWRARRLTYFGLDGTVQRTARLQSRSVFAEGLAPLGDSTLMLSTEAGYSMPPDPEREGKFWLVRMALDGTILDTVIATTGTDQVPYRTEQFLTVIRAPFARGPRWDVAPDGRIAFGRGDSYDIALYEYPASARESGAPAPARLALRIRRATPPLPVTDADISAYRDGYLGAENLSAEDRRRYEAMLETVTYPETWPAFQALRFDRAGRLWARRPAHTGDTLAAWDLFEPGGRYLGAVELPTALTVQVVTLDAVYGILRDQLDVQYVKRYRIEGLMSPTP